MTANKEMHRQFVKAISEAVWNLPWCAGVVICVAPTDEDEVVCFSHQSESIAPALAKTLDKASAVLKRGKPTDTDTESFEVPLENDS